MRETVQLLQKQAAQQNKNTPDFEGQSSGEQKVSSDTCIYKLIFAASPELKSTGIGLLVCLVFAFGFPPILCRLSPMGGRAL